MFTEMDQSCLAAIYFSGLIIAEALRIPQRIIRFKSRNIWRKPHNSSSSAEKIVLVSVVTGIWILPLINSFTSWLSAFDISLPTWSVWTGIFLFIVSLIIRITAQLTLARSWSFTLETSEKHQFIQHGIYSLTRHPIYISLIFWAIAQLVLLQNYIAGFGGMVAVALIWLIRVPREEKLMLEVFGRDYEYYIERTGRFFPKRRIGNQIE